MGVKVKCITRGVTIKMFSPRSSLACFINLHWLFRFCSTRLMASDLYFSCVLHSFLVLPHQWVPMLLRYRYWCTLPAHSSSYKLPSLSLKHYSLCLPLQKTLLPLCPPVLAPRWLHYKQPKGWLCSSRHVKSFSILHTSVMQKMKHRSLTK